MRLAATVLLGLAAASAALGGSGLVVVPHAEAPGTDPSHEHALTVYRFPLLLIGAAPGMPSTDELAHHVRAAHVHHLQGLLGMPGAAFGPVHPLAELAGAAVLALLAFAVPRLPRPTRRVVAEMPIPRVVTAQWRSWLATPPPRLRVFASA